MPNGGEAMTDEEELRILRARVYGPDADVDPEAIRRLHELEAARRPRVSVAGVTAAGVTVTEEPDSVAVVPISEKATTPVEPAEPLSREILRRVKNARRSTLLIAVSVIVFVALVIAALTVVQRVQSDPLQSGAEQVARLSVDPSFRTPDMFRGGPNGDIETQGFQQFHGLRAIVTASGFFGARTDSPCMGVYPDSAIESPEANSFSGPLIGGCQMGGFPAIATFASDLDGFPEELVEAYPGYGFQFVYDQANNEVVVFASK